MKSTKFAMLTLAVSLMLAQFLHDNSEGYEASALGIDAIRLSDPSLKNVAGEKIDTIEVGQQAIIGISIHNNNNREQAFVILIEIRDSTGITHQLSWQSGRIAANGDYGMEVSWIPTGQGCMFIPDYCTDNYEIRTFALTSIENPQVLSAISKTDGIKVIDFPPNPPLDQQQFELVLHDGRKYTIDYSFSKGEGKIAEIEVVDNKTKSVTFVLTDVSENSRFTVTMPMFLYNHLLVNNEENKSVQIDAFVDGKRSTSFSSLSDNQIRSMMFIFSLAQGTEKVKIVGTPVD